MPENERELPLFPLNTVLFPGAAMPLQVFEPRYRAMMSDIEAGDNQFGVVLIRAGREVGGPALPHDVGTIASVADAVRAGGRIRLNAVGGGRFRVLDLLDGKPYLRARVRLLDDDAAEVNPDLTRQVREAFFAYLDVSTGLIGGWVHEECEKVDGKELSYFIAMRMDAVPSIKQRLLEVDSHNARLAEELRMLHSETELLRQTPRLGRGSSRLNLN